LTVETLIGEARRDSSREQSCWTTCEERKAIVKSVNVAIIYYSATGTVHALACAAAEGAEMAGAHVRLRKVAELTPAETINAIPAWRQHLKDTADVAEVSSEDMIWADAVLWGTPTRFGNPSSQLKAFIDSLGVLWQRGVLADKVYSAFTASGTSHGGQESTIAALGNVFYHWGGIIVPPGYTDPVQSPRGNPCRTSHAAGDDPLPRVVLEAVRCQAQRVVDTAVALKAARGQDHRTSGRGVIVAGPDARLRARNRTHT
jgi:NAD(P)H dehydrogenase (quinone)